MKLNRSTSLAIAASAALLFNPACLHAASILGSAGDFTVLGGTSITSSGAIGTIISNGNVGLSPGPTMAITGFPPAVITNGAIVPTGPVTSQARLDLMRAQVGLAGMPSNTNLSNVNLAGKTLAPGVYTFDTDASLNGTLTLDAQGRNNVFWVFQIGTSLTTGMGASVTVINPGSNGGRDCGIFWNCGSTVTIGANNQIAGNYLSGTSMAFGATSNGGGRALALAGVSLDNNQIDALGGPGGGDWSGGLIFNDAGAVVPQASASSQTLAFRHFGSRHRTTSTASRVINGSASGGATSIQWRINGKSWQRVAVRSDNRWTVQARPFHVGRNQLRLRARNAAGAATAVQSLTIWRH